MLKSPRYYNISIGILKFATWVEDLYNKFVNINSYLWEKKQFFNGTTNWKTTTCFYTQLFSIAQILSWFNVHLLEQKFYKILLAVLMVQKFYSALYNTHLHKKQLK
jgi:hypothetical protein